MKRLHQLRTSLRLESLESREVPAVINVVPTSQTEDAFNKFTLAAAVTAASAGDTIVVRSGTTADTATVLVNKAVNIAGDATVPAYLLAKYSVFVTAPASVLNMNLQDVAVAGVITGAGVSVMSSIIVNYNEIGSVGTDLVNNTITGSAVFNSNSTAGGSKQVVVEGNTFQTNAQNGLWIQDATNVSVRGNRILSGANGNKLALGVFGNSTNVQIVNNTIRTAGDFGIYLANGTSTGTAFTLSARIANNAVSTARIGYGLIANRAVLGSLTASVEGNDFQNNLYGVAMGAAVGAPNQGNIDLGGGSTGFGTSLGGNNFRGYTGSNNNYALYMLANTSGVAQAQFNVFDVGMTVGSVVLDGSDVGGTAGTFNTANNLNANRSVVQSLYTNVLKRAGTVAELDGWANQIPVVGLAVVARRITYSTEALNRTVAGYYDGFLGRTASTAEVSGWVSAIQGGLSLENVQASFIGSAEYASKNSLNFVTDVYGKFLGRPAAAAEISGWNSVLTGQGRAAVALGLLKSSEGLGNTIRELYAVHLRRGVSVGEVSAWFATGLDSLSIQTLILGSGEFYNRG